MTRAARVVRLHPHERSRSQATHDKLASEDLGKELNPHSSIWQLYAEESKDQDNELTLVCNQNLDTLLLFATLFSAILAAFLVETVQLLQPDPAETSLELLLALAQSQRRIEVGAPDTLLPPIETTPFEPSGSARLVNALWFSALAISLGAAMVAILAKEWLGAFTSYRTRDPYQYTLERQARFRSLESWAMLPIIDFLPTLLNFSLLLFALGLIIQLWTLDYVVAGVVTVLTALVGLSYGGFTILGAAVDTCPYKSRLSVYVGMISLRLKRSDKKFPKPPTAPRGSYIKPTDLDSLSWLLDNAQDPTTTDYTCQALAGLKSLKLDQSVFLIQSAQGFLTVRQSNGMIWGNVLRMGAQVADRLATMTTKYRSELVALEGKNAARYAIALSEIYPYALAWLQQPNAADESAQDHDVISSIQYNAQKITTSVFAALDSLWKQASPPLTVNSYCGLALAELKLIEHILTYRRITGQPDAISGELNTGHTSVNVPGAEALQGVPNLPELRDRYKRTLGRASVLIQGILDDSSFVGDFQPHSLVHDLLVVITELVGREELHPDEDYKAYVYDGDTSITVIDPYDNYGPSPLENRRIGLIGSLMGLFSSWRPDNHVDITNHQSRKRFLNTALKLMEIVRPKVTKQWASSNGVMQWPSFFQDSGASPAIRRHYRLSNPQSDSIMRQCLEIANVAAFLLGRPDLDNMIRILDAALTPLIANQSATARPEHHFLHRVILGKPCLFFDWIKKVQAYKPPPPIMATDGCYDRVYVDSTSEVKDIKRRLCGRIAELLSIQGRNDSTIGRDLLDFLDHEAGHSSADFAAILKILRTAGKNYDSIEATKKALHDLVGHITTTAGGLSVSTPVKDPCSTCLECFTQEEGFRLLRQIGILEPEEAAQAIVDIVLQLSASRKQLGANVIDSFLKAVRLVCDYYPENWNELSNSFVPAAIKHLQQLEPGLESFVSRGTIPSIQTTLDKLYEAAQHMSIMALKSQVVADIDSMIELVQRYSPATSTSSLIQVHVDYPPPRPLVAEREGRIRCQTGSARRRGTYDTIGFGRRTSRNVEFNKSFLGRNEPPLADDRISVAGPSDELGVDATIESEMHPGIGLPSLGLSHMASGIPEVPSEIGSQGRSSKYPDDGEE
ncbi:hypothetical protein ACGC1H_000233 [Rhizoctonia solani]|uniref:DUF6535 domain-containing protein n=1 Tax=Rhizoctonia solani TaxID=456999 RepID=A0A8H2WQU5_9AGAM|nr:unnamed protein product [Rhizoctonia solani]